MTEARSGRFEGTGIIGRPPFKTGWVINIGFVSGRFEGTGIIGRPPFKTDCAIGCQVGPGRAVLKRQGSLQNR